MPLPSANDLKTMDYSYNAQPFVCIPSKSSVNLTSLDFSYFGIPFCTNGYSVITTFIKKINGLLKISTKSVKNVMVSYMKSWNGVT